MIFERITTPKHPLYIDAINLYKISFPPHEQREETSQIEILRNPAYHFDAVCDDGTFVGEILYWNIDSFLYIEHFAFYHPCEINATGRKSLPPCRRNR